MTKPKLNDIEETLRLNDHRKEVLKERFKSKGLQVGTITEKIREIGEIVELKIANVQITA